MKNPSRPADWGFRLNSFIYKNNATPVNRLLNTREIIIIYTIVFIIF
jgi:hypothetical protein